MRVLHKIDVMRAASKFSRRAAGRMFFAPFLLCAVFVAAFLSPFLSSAFLAAPAFSQERSAVGAAQLYKTASEQLRAAGQSGDIQSIKEVIRVLQRAYRENPKYFEAARDLARAYYLVSDYKNAMEYADAALALRGSDRSLQILRAQIIMRSAGPAAARERVLEIMAAYPTDPYALYTASVYFGMLGDDKNYARVLESFRRLFTDARDQEALLYAYAVIEAAANVNLGVNLGGSPGVNSAENFSAQSEKAFEFLAGYADNPWISWLLLQYVQALYGEPLRALNAAAAGSASSSSGGGSAANADPRLRQAAAAFDTYTQNLLKSSVPFLQQEGYAARFESFFSYDVPKALQEAAKYTEAFPESSDAWFSRAAALYASTPPNYSAAAQAVERARRADPENEFFNFMYDRALKAGLYDQYDLVIARAQSRVADYVRQGEAALTRGAISRAFDAARRALYIMPLSTQARLLYANVLRRRGNLAQAEEELSLVRGADDAPADLGSRIESMQSDVRAAIATLDQPRLVSEINSEINLDASSRDVIPWNMIIELSSDGASKSRGSAGGANRGNFYKDYLSYALLQYPTIRIDDTLRDAGAVRTGTVRAEVSFIDDQGVFTVRARLSDDESSRTFLTIVESRRGNNRITAATAAAAERMSGALPVLLSVLGSRGNTVLAGGAEIGKAVGGLVLPLFNAGKVSAVSQSPYFIDTGKLIGFARIEAAAAGIAAAALQQDAVSGWSAATGTGAGTAAAGGTAAQGPQQNQQQNPPAQNQTQNQAAQGAVQSAAQQGPTQSREAAWREAVKAAVSGAYEGVSINVFDTRAELNRNDVIIIPPVLRRDDRGAASMWNAASFRRAHLLSTMILPVWK